MDLGALLGMSFATEGMGNIRMASETRLDDRMQLKRFETWGDLGPVYLEASALRLGGTLHVKYRVPLLLLSGKEVLEFPKEGMIGGNFLPVPAGGTLTPGKRWRSHLLDIDFLSGRPRFTHAYFSVAEELVMLDWNGKRVQTHRVEMRYKPQDVQQVPTAMAWVDLEGRVLKQTIALGRREAELILDHHLEVGQDKVSSFSWSIEVPKRRDPASERP
jgi:hypothetical protein